MSLARHIRAQNWTDLEDAWTELILAEADAGMALEALRTASERKEIARCIALVRDHAEMLAASGRAQQAAELVGMAMVLGGSPGELGKQLFQYSETAWGSLETWPIFTEISDLRENSQDLRSSWKCFQQLLALEPGRVVYHSKGWGLGQIEELDLTNRMVRVRFESGRQDNFPLQTAIDIFEMLAPDDLRALKVLDPEALKRRMKEDPLDILRWVLRRNRGRVNHAGIKLHMGMLGLDGPKFSAWWRKAKKLAETSEWFELSGPATRVQVRLLDQAEDPAVAFRRQLERAPLGQALARVRELLSGGTAPDELRAAGCETLEARARDENEPMPQRLGVWLFLRDITGQTPEILTEFLEHAAATEASVDPSKAPELWRLFQGVSTSREQERCIELLQEVYGESWIDQSARHLPHAAPGMAKGLVDALAEAGRGQELVAHYTTLLARPTRNPMLLVRLGEYIEKNPDPHSLPAPLQRAQCLLQLGVHLFRSTTAEPKLARVKTRLSSLLTEGKDPLIARLLVDADLESLRNLATMIEGGIDRPIDRAFTKFAIAMSPDVFRDTDERPFWESGLWTTRPAYRVRQEELRLLKDVKIPANSEAIGKAASFGDLSENSEWEAAIEEQRTLTTRAQEFEIQLREAQFIENASIAEDTVAPGTRVDYREIETGDQHAISILGPWDVGEGVVSYRSPLAAGMLGLHPGDRARIELPTGTIDVEVLGIELLPLA